MNKNNITKYTIIILIVLTAGLIIGYFYINKTSDKIDGFKDITDTYIFGGSSGEEGGDIRFDKNGDLIIKEDQDIPVFRKISSEPVAGFVLFDEDGLTVARYVEKATGHIYEITTDSVIKKRISNTTIPKIQEVVWLDKKSLIFRYFDKNGIKSFSAEILENKDDLSKEGEIEGVFLNDNIQKIIPIENKIIYLITNQFGSQIISSERKGDNKIEIFKSPLKEWNFERPKKGILSLTTKPSFDVLGNTYLFNVNTENLDKIIDNIKGLTILSSNNFKNILFSNKLYMYMYNLTEENFKKILIKTLPEKCVWSNNNKDIYCGVPNNLEKGNYPDDWYQGLVSFSDNLIKMNTENDTKEIIFSPKNFLNIEVDMINLSLSEDEKYLFFINKKDSSFWSLELNKSF